MSHPTLARLLAAAVLACAAGVAPAQNVGSYGMGVKPPPPSPDVLQSLDISPAKQNEVLGTTIPLDGTFYDHTGAAVTLREVIGGKPTVLVPVYFKCPRLCNQTAEALLEALRQMRGMKPKLVAGEDFNVVFFSIDSFEHPQQANGRRNAFHQDYDGRGKDTPGVWFLSANPTNRGDHALTAHATITEVTDAIGFKFVRMNTRKQAEVPPDKVAQEIQHPAAVLVLTPTGKVSSYLTGVLTLDANELADHVRTAGRGDVGAADGRKSLDCYFGDDSPEGWYRFTMRAMAVVAVPVVLLAGALVWRARARAKAEAKGPLPPPSGADGTGTEQ
jgi:protein SCO1/2